MEDETGRTETGGGPSMASWSTVDALAIGGGVCAWVATVAPMASPGMRDTVSALWWITVSAFLAAFLLGALVEDQRVASVAAGALPVLFVAAVVLLPTYELTGALAVVSIALIGLVFDVRVTLGVAFTQSVIVGAVTGVAERSWLPGVVWAVIYLGLELFAVAMVEARRRESVARREERRARTELAAAQARLAEASAASERLRIARDLHDQVGHQLTALALNLETAKHLSTGTAAHEPVALCRDLAKETLADVRAVVGRLRETPSLEYSEDRFVARLHEMATAVPTPDVIVRVEGVTALSPAVHDALLHCAQEVITNAARHSGATRLHIDVWGEGDEVVLRGVDDGRGAPHGLVAGHGLTGMKERFAALGGVVTAGDDAPGFRVVGRLPSGRNA